MVLPLWAQHKVKSNYEKYSQVRSTSGKTGQEVALEILHANGIYDVDVVEGQGFLTDHCSQLSHYQLNSMLVVEQ